MSEVTCEHCGFRHATATDNPDCTRIDCLGCGTTEFIWKDNEFDDGYPPSFDIDEDPDELD